MYYLFHPQVVWFKNNANLNLVKGDMNGRVGMDLAFGLVMTDIQHSDRGFYTCKGSNIHGDASMTTELNIMGIFLFVCLWWFFCVRVFVVVDF